ncbi:Modification methylase BspRI [Clavibacter nebraskensis]|jgi:DNA (cytosine-5)-methyltransferase 1
MRFRMGELFCGPGGMALGAHLAAAEVPGIELEHAWANDYDRDTVDTYMRNIPGAGPDSVLHQDVRELDIESLTHIDGFAFGFPCNDFSRVGERKGMNGAFGPLYKYGVNVLDRHSPEWFVAENVGDLRSSNEGEAFRQIMNELEHAGDAGGYRLTPHLYKFEQYGLPQRRHRILIVGVRRDIDIDFRIPSTEPYAGIDNSAGYRLENPPIGPEITHNELTRQKPHVVERLQHILPGQSAFTADLPEHLRLKVSGATLSQIYKRLERDKPSYTVTGSGGGGTHVYHYEEPRALTNRERARLQTFPDDFQFTGGRDSVRRQIGMAVPVEGAHVVFSALFKSFTGQDYPSAPSNLPRAVATLF